MSLIDPCRVLVCLLALAFASPTAARQPGGEDASTPRGALKAITLALDSGDEPAMRRLLLAENPQQQEWTDAMIELSSSMNAVRRQAVQTFGAEGARAVVGDTAFALAAALRQIDDSTEELNGELAIVRSTDPEERPLALRKVNGAWVVPVPTITGDANPEEYPPVAQRMRLQAKAIQTVTDDIASGRLVTPEQAAEALHRRQFEALVQDAPMPPPPATQPPTTQPPQ